MSHFTRTFTGNVRMGQIEIYPDQVLVIHYVCEGFRVLVNLRFVPELERHASTIDVPSATSDTKGRHDWYVCRSSEKV